MKQKLVLAVAILAMSMPVSANTREIRVYLNKKEVNLEGFIVYTDKGRTMVPLRMIAQLTGAKVDYNSKTKEIYIEREGKNITLKIGLSKAVINGKQVEVAGIPELKENIAMVPLRFISEALDIYIEYDEERRHIDLNTLKYNVPDDIVDGYMLVIDKIYGSVKGSKSSSGYIAIDTSHMRYLDTTNKQQLLKRLEDYGIAIESTYKELKQKGLINEEGYFAQGILIEIDDLSSYEDKLILDIWTGKGILGANGYEGMILEKENNKWQITNQGVWWTS